MTLNVTKSQLGKLLAEENIRIEHRQVEGPYFDVKNRLLVLPMWKDMDADLYDLFIGHEVGHAIYTPAEGWDTLVDERGESFRTVLNIVEDARIEKKMKRKFPGLVRPMYQGYSQLVEKNFFGVKLEEMKHFPFLDRINTHFKLGVRADISFNETEQLIVDRIANAESWQEVVNISEQLYKHAENEIEEMQKKADDKSKNIMQEFSIEIVDGDEDGNDFQSITELPDNISDNLRQFIENMIVEGEPRSMTEDVLKNSQQSLIDKNQYPFLYIKMPQLKISDWVIPSKVTYSLMQFNPSFYEQRDKLYLKFMGENKKYISYMVKEFELRRNAKQFAKARTTKTGKLDTNKLSKIRLTDDVFLQSTVVPNGKNHGMIMLVDMSSSMSDCIGGTIDQTISLAMFCRKVNIPFEVYGFFDNGMIKEEFNKMGWDLNNWNLRNDTRPGRMYISKHTFRLKQLFHAQMSHNEFTNAVKSLLMLAQAYRNRNRYYSSSYDDRQNIPNNMALGGTPLNESLLLLPAIANKFRENTKVDILNTIILTDGDSSYNMTYTNKEGHTVPFNFMDNIVLEDNDNKQVETVSRYATTNGLIRMYKKLTGSNVFGYYLHTYYHNTKNRLISHCAGINTKMSPSIFSQLYEKQYLKHKYIGLNSDSYNTYYIMAANEIDLKSDGIAVEAGKDGTVDKKSLLKAFKKVQSGKQVSRAFLNHFIAEIS